MITIISSLLYVITGIIISNYYHKRNMDRRIKVDTFKRVFSNRYDLKGEEFSQAINEIFVIYNNSEQVIKALNNFHDTATSNNKNSANEDD